MRIYLAARYSRRKELCGYRADLQKRGHHVTSSWLDGHHEIFGDKEAMDLQHARDNLREQKRQQFAVEDLTDLLSADTLIAFTEAPRETKTRGGRHVEFGVALGKGMRLVCVGPRENVFYSLPGVEHFDDWTEAVAALEKGS